MALNERAPTTPASATWDLDVLLEKQLSKTRKRKEWRAFIIQTLLVMLAIYVLLTVIFGVTIIHGDSMNPTIQDGDVVLLWRLSRSYQPGDIVLFESEASPELLIKRVVAVPGDVVDIDNDAGRVLVNNAPIEEPYIFAGTYQMGRQVEYPMPGLEKGEYFVLGDNRTTALDSRSAEVGPVSQGDIVGKVILLIRAG